MSEDAVGENTRIVTNTNGTQFHLKWIRVQWKQSVACFFSSWCWPKFLRFSTMSAMAERRRNTGS